MINFPYDGEYTFKYAIFEIIFLATAYFFGRVINSERKIFSLDMQKKSPVRLTLRKSTMSSVYSFSDI